MTGLRKSLAARLARQPRWFRIAIYTAAALVLLPFVLVLLYRFVDPPISMPMVREAIFGNGVRHSWVPLERISRNLVAAVVTSEDSRFCAHWGVDWDAVGRAIDEAEEDGGPLRGASTIPMQTAKNLFLWQERSYLRKAIELPMAHVMSLVWPKWRMLEIYLNIAEWGPGVFGAEAAARHHFGTSAARLSRRQAALLAAALPNPHRRNAGRPGPGTRRLAWRIEQRVAREGNPLDCIYGGQTARRAHWSAEGNASIRAPVTAAGLGYRRR